MEVAVFRIADFSTRVDGVVTVVTVTEEEARVIAQRNRELYREAPEMFTNLLAVAQ